MHKNFFNFLRLAVLKNLLFIERALLMGYEGSSSARMENDRYIESFWKLYVSKKISQESERLLIDSSKYIVQLVSQFNCFSDSTIFVVL